jgi:hypothetical protein
MKNLYHAEPAESKFEHCARCQSVDLREEERPPHIGLFCNHCGAWLRWVPRREKGKYTSASAAKSQHSLELVEPKKINPRLIAHPVTLEDRVASLEHDIGVIAQIVMGAGE